MTDQTKSFRDYLKETNSTLCESLVVAGVEVTSAVAGTESMTFVTNPTGEEAINQLPKIEAPIDNMSIAKAGLAMIQSAGITEATFVKHINNIKTMLG